MWKDIPYTEIVEYYLKSINDISNIIYHTQKQYDKNTEEWQAIESSYLSWYGSKEKAYYRIKEILDMKEYYVEEDFQYWALEKCSDARHRIQHYLDDATSLLDFSTVEYTKYDDIVMDYYQPIRLNFEGEFSRERSQAFEKYSSISHRKTMINLGLVYEIDSVRESIDHSKDLTSTEKRQQKNILDKILKLVKQLKGYDEDYD